MHSWLHFTSIRGVWELRYMLDSAYMCVCMRSRKYTQATNYVCTHESSIRYLENRKAQSKQTTTFRSPISVRFLDFSLCLQLRESRKRVPSESDLRNLGISASAQRDHRRHNACAFHVSFYCLCNNDGRNFTEIRNNAIKIISFLLKKLSSNLLNNLF